MEKLSVLQKRLELLEDLLLSNNPSYSNKEQVVPALTKISKRVNEAEKNNSTLKRIYSQLDDLEKFAALCHADVIEKPTSAKIDFIQASERQLREEAKHLENVERLKWVLDSEHLKSRVTSDLNVKMLKASEVQSHQREQTAECLEQTKELVENYNKAISSISKQFERWNAVVARLEEEQNVIKE